MKAIRVSAPVGVDGLVYEDAPDPKPAIGDVLVKVHACGFTASELSGAVGSIAVQLAKAKDVHVVGTGRSKVKSLVLDLGADDFVDVEQDAW